MNDSYEMNEKDIDSTLNFLRIYDPENATPEKAIDFLEHLHTGVHRMSHSHPEQLEELYDLFKNDSDKSTDA